jgi:hypothetical protein
MLSDYLDGKLKFDLQELLKIKVAPTPPSYDIDVLSLDIETYGKCSKFPDQTMFHPVKSEKWDKVSPKDMVLTVGLSWRDQKGRLQHAIFHMSDRQHQRRLWAWFRFIKLNPRFQYLLGHNIVFDLMYLRYCYREAKLYLDDPLPVMDTIVLNYLQDESRPEKSLKDLAPLFRITKYDPGHGKKSEFIRYATTTDPMLWQYNCQDTASTLMLSERLMAEIRGLYGKDTKKLSPFCMKWYSQLLWMIVWMSEEGIRMDEGKLEGLLARYEKAQDAILSHSVDAYEAPLRGKGSEKAKRKAMSDGLAYVQQWNPENIPNLELTKGGKVSFSVENRNALLEVLDKGSSERALLKLMSSYQDVSGMLDRYLYPMLIGRGKKRDVMDTVLLDGFAYPRWFPVPSEYEDASAGGTKQARIVAKGPPCQTFPPSVKGCLVCRFDDGYFIWVDYSQIELRVAALLSGDEPMIREYMGKPDLHGKTAKLIFGEDIVRHPEYKSKYRQAGKTLNFLVLYRGGARKFQQTLLRDVGIDYPIAKCVHAVQDFFREHPQLIAWQDEMCRVVFEQGFYELPLIGQSRLFLGGKRAHEKHINEIVNLPVQAIAANITLSAQYDLWAAFKKAGLKATVACNIYDAALIECPRYEIHRVRDVMNQVLPRPSFYRSLCAELGRELPLEYESKEVAPPARKKGRRRLTRRSVRV